jgi:Cd2+/Zn2+-exporting ATPase
MTALDRARRLPPTGAVAGDQPVPVDPVPASSARPMAPPPARRSDEEEGLWERWRLVGAAVLCWAFLAAAVLLERAGGPPPAAVALFALAYLAGGTFAAWGALTDLVRHRTVNVDLLMVTAAIGAAAVGSWAEGAILLGLFSSSNALEHHALGRTRRAVRALMELSPQVATVLRPEGELVVPVEDVRLGETVLVRPGERVAVDGVVVAGETAIDQSAITGESVPVGKTPGDPVFAGTINGAGAVRVRAEKLHRESTLARIVAFVEEAQAQKSRAQRFTDAFEGRYAVGVLLVAAGLAVVPPLALGVAWGEAFYRAMTLLVVASPCALVISTPAATLSALANAARHGILFKGGNHLEDAGVLKTVAFDKTGTLTVGRPCLTDVVVLDPVWGEERLLRLAASAERLSEHHLGEAVVRAAGERGLALVEPKGFRAVAGKGIIAEVAGETVVVGNDALFAELGVAVGTEATAEADRLRGEGKTAIFVGGVLGPAGILGVADTERPAAAAVVRRLRAQGIGRVVMLTGDNGRVAAAIGDRLGIAPADVRADLLPEEKLAVIADLKRLGPVAMVGDGVNDAPALAAADLGVAMGGSGTDVALETADVVLIGDDLARLPYAIALSRKTRRTIRQNLAFSLAVIAVLVVSALTVGIPLPLGVVGHEGSTVIVVLNGLRLLRSLE